MGVLALVLAGAVAGFWTPDLERNVLENKYATTNTHFVVVQGLRIHYQDSGPKDAPVLLLLHGFGSSLQTWDVWAQSLESKYRVIRLDLPGFGLTGPNPDQKYADLDDVQAIARFADHLGLTEFSLLGHSMGGKIAWNFAAAYPQRAVKWIVPFAAGGSGDTIARLLAERMGAALGQPVLIDNRGGNGSVLGTEVAAKAAPDGHTWVLSNGAAITTGPLLGQVTTYKPLEDFAHVVLIGSFTNALIVRQDHPAKNLQEFLALARSQPGKWSYGSAGVGSAGFLTGEMLKQLAQVDMVHIPYKGSGPALNDLLGGQTDAMFNALISSAPHIRSGRVRALAITAAARDA